MHGSSTTHTEAANTVPAFMISSLYKKWSTGVRLLPCAKSSGDQIRPILHEVVKDVESYNLQIQVICTDNYSLNENLLKFTISYLHLGNLCSPPTTIF